MSEKINSKTKILFAHQSFPGQFGELAKFLDQENWSVLFATTTPKVSRKRIQRTKEGLRVIGFDRPEDASGQIHSFAAETENAILNAHGFAEMALKLKRGGYNPNIVVAHSGWGTGSFVKSVWPDTKFVQYLEWWYKYPERDVQYDQLIPSQTANKHARSLCRNIPFLLDASTSDAIIVPTKFQAADVPKELKRKTIIHHDGVDCDFFSPSPTNEKAKIKFGDFSLDSNTKIVTYATRGMEPMRGFPEFMAAWEIVQKKMPNVHCIIAGNDRVHYSNWLPEGESYKKRALDTHDFDLSRLHFVGKLKKNVYRNLLRRSNCHVYLTRPFVLSWSLVEAMATGCPLVVSDNAAIREALPHKGLAVHVDHCDVASLSEGIMSTLSDQTQSIIRGGKARDRAIKKYDGKVLWPEKEDIFNKLIESA